MNSENSRGGKRGKKPSVTIVTSTDPDTVRAFSDPDDDDDVNEAGVVASEGGQRERGGSGSGSGPQAQEPETTKPRLSLVTGASSPPSTGNNSSKAEKGTHHHHDYSDDDDDAGSSTSTTSDNLHQRHPQLTPPPSIVIRRASADHSRGKYLIKNAQGALGIGGGDDDEDGASSGDPNSPGSPGHHHRHHKDLMTSETNDDGAGDGNGGENKDTEEVQVANDEKTLFEIFQDITATELQWKMRFFHIFHGQPAMDPDAKIALGYNLVQVVFVIISTVLMMIETLPEFYEPEMSTEWTWLFILETITVIVFTVDLMLRCAAATPWQYIFRPWFVVDFLSVIGYYIEVIIAETSSGSSQTVLFLILRGVRIFRVFRLMKLHRSQKGLSLMYAVIVKSKDGLFLLLVLVGIATLCFASLIYFVEIQFTTFDDENEVWVRDDGTDSPFQSIPHTSWFVVVSLTTVGYGDEVPYSTLGRACTIVIMLFGILVLSFPNILIGSNFQDAHRSMHRNKARKTLGKWFRRVRMVTRFIRMWREFRVKGKLVVYAKNENATGGTIVPDDICNNASQLFRPMKIERPGASSEFQRMTHFMVREQQDFPQFDYALTYELFHDKGNLDFSVDGIGALDFLQRVLEGFSAVCTLDELRESYLLYPSSVRGKEMKEPLLEIAAQCQNARLLKMYVISRLEGNILVGLTKKGVDVLSNYPERDPMPCVRCFSEARDIWLNTTKENFMNFLPMDGYRKWQQFQATVPRRSPIDFCYDLKNPQAKANHVFAAPVAHYSMLHSVAANSDIVARGVECGCSGRKSSFSNSNNNNNQQQEYAMNVSAATTAFSDQDGADGGGYQYDADSNQQQQQQRCSSPSRVRFNDGTKRPQEGGTSNGGGCGGGGSNFLTAKYNQGQHLGYNNNLNDSSSVMTTFTPRCPSDMDDLENQQQQQGAMSPHALGGGARGGGGGGQKFPFIPACQCRHCVMYSSKYNSSSSPSHQKRYHFSDLLNSFCFRPDYEYLQLVAKYTKNEAKLFRMQETLNLLRSEAGGLGIDGTKQKMSRALQDMLGGSLGADVLESESDEEDEDEEHAKMDSPATMNKKINSGSLTTQDSGATVDLAGSGGDLDSNGSPLNGRNNGGQHRAKRRSNTEPSVDDDDDSNPGTPLLSRGASEMNIPKPDTGGGGTTTSTASSRGAPGNSSMPTVSFALGNNNNNNNLSGYSPERISEQRATPRTRKSAQLSGGASNNNNNNASSSTLNNNGGNGNNSVGEIGSCSVDSSNLDDTVDLSKTASLMTLPGAVPPPSNERDGGGSSDAEEENLARTGTTDRNHSPRDDDLGPTNGNSNHVHQHQQPQERTSSTTTSTQEGGRLSVSCESPDGGSRSRNGSAQPYHRGAGPISPKEADELVDDAMREFAVGRTKR